MTTDRALCRGNPLIEISPLKINFQVAVGVAMIVNNYDPLYPLYSLLNNCRAAGGGGGGGSGGLSAFEM